MTQSRVSGHRRSQVTAERYQALVEGAQDYAVLMLDIDGLVISWNQGAEKITGYTKHEILGSHFSRFYPPEAVARELPAHELEVAARVGSFEDAGWRVRKDGSLFWANVIIARMTDAAGELVGFSKITRDLTEQRAQDLKHRQSEERFRLLVSGVKDYAIFMLDPDGLVATWNAGARQIKGYAAHEIIGSHFSRFYPPEALKRNLPAAELQAAMMQGRIEDEGWRIRKDGSRFWANVIITAVRNSAGQLIGYSKITRDLSERRAHEEALRQGEERFRLLVDGVTEYAITMLDAEGFVASWNAGAERIKGYKSAEILGKHHSHFYPIEAIAANQPWEDLARAQSERQVAREDWRLRKDGTLFWASSVITALRDRDDNLYGFATVTQDLTQRRHAEALADTAQRMHEFIAMLAHELRNPLAPIRNAVALMGRKGLQDPTLEAMRQTIDRQSTQLVRLLDELLEVNRIARGQFTVERSPTDIREVITRAVESSRPLIDAHSHTIELEMPDFPVMVSGDVVRLTQATVNLLNNAAKCTAAGGRIQLVTTVRGADVEIRIRDNGKGIDSTMLEKIFDLFFQIDPQAGDTMGGLGVGLALVRRVVELHGGSVQARSDGLGRGSEFILRLPLSIQQLEVVSATTLRAESPLPRLRVLVVDDNHDVADTLELLLQAMGQDVAKAYDGPSALKLAKGFEPDVVLLDIGMPQMSGYGVARAIRACGLKSSPELVAITGWGQEADKQRAIEAGFGYHFVKPISEDRLRDILLQLAPRARAH